MTKPYLIKFISNQKVFCTLWFSGTEETLKERIGAALNTIKNNYPTLFVTHLANRLIVDYCPSIQIATNTVYQEEILKIKLENQVFLIKTPTSTYIPLTDYLEKT
jgi:hypothetical protein